MVEPAIEALPETEVAFRRSIGFAPWEELSPEVQGFIIEKKTAEQPEREWWRSTETGWRAFGPWNPRNFRASWLLGND